MLKCIVAMNEKGVIGRGLSLPFRLSNDLKNVKRVTENQTIVYGYNTYLSLNQKPLPNRKNIVLYNGEFKMENGIEFYPIQDYLDMVKKSEKEDIFIFGGASIYQLFFPYIQELHLTKVLDDLVSEDSIFFPQIDWENFKLVEQSEVFSKDDKNEFEHQFFIYKRI